MSKTLHIYGQAFEHQEAKIVGNLDALSALRDALNEAVHARANVTFGFVGDGLFASDGEGYEIKIVVMPDENYEKVYVEKSETYPDGFKYQVNKKWAENPPQYLAEVILTAEDEIRGPARELLAALKKLVNLAPIHNYPESTILEAKLAIAHAEEIL